ncbi:helix-hairpin-helix domain-containing protein [Cupriavidus pauculus]|jgi:competence protein ComEA|uniref:ComEA family DNA-binding protein n=1 Tax=Cupriavidus pauculus TaxID=82633 RepID=UPI0030F79BE4
MHKTSAISLSNVGAALLRGWRRAGMALALLLALSGIQPAYADVDVNSADEAALMSVKGIGPATAKRILEERDKNGAYKDAGDLSDRVPGVGPKSVAHLQEAGLTFGAAATTARKDAKPAAKPAAKAAAAR